MNVSKWFGVICVLHSCSTMAMAEQVKLSAKSDYVEYCMGEPIQLTLTLVNSGDEEKEFDLGADGIEKIEINVVHNGETNIVKGPLPPGVSRLVVLRLPARSITSTSFFFDEFYRPESSGVYELSIRIPYADVSVATTAVTILPETEANNELLGQRYADYANKLRSSEATDQELKYIRNKIIYSRNVAATDLQEVVLRRREYSDQEFVRIAYGLIETRTPRSIQLLVDDILNSNQSTEYEKNTVLTLLKYVGAEKWQDELFEIIKPYLHDKK